MLYGPHRSRTSDTPHGVTGPSGAGAALERRYLLAQPHGWQGIQTQAVFVFVGERRSRRAAEMGVCLIDGRLAGKTLHDALRAAGLAPERSVFLNLFHDAPGDPRPCDNALQAVRSLAAAGAVVVGLGRRVQTALSRAGVDHVALTHPAARGAIRVRASYQRHVREVLAAAAPATQLAPPSARDGEDKEELPCAAWPRLRQRR
jgi:hypothetical protein